MAERDALNEVSGNEPVALRRYLLGTVSPEAGDEIEDRFAEDEAYFTAYKQGKQELVVEFAAGRMTAAEAACFVRSYLTSARCQQEAIVVKALLSVQAEPPLLRTAWRAKPNAEMNERAELTLYFQRQPLFSAPGTNPNYRPNRAILADFLPGPFRTHPLLSDAQSISSAGAVIDP
jgi:hypothetical protein